MTAVSTERAELQQELPLPPQHLSPGPQMQVGRVLRAGQELLPHSKGASGDRETLSPR